MAQVIQAEQAAQELLKRFGDEIPVDVSAIAEYYGASIRFGNFDDSVSGMVVLRQGQPLIGVNARHHPNRQRFTVAHELAHLILHKDIASFFLDEKSILFRDQVSSEGTSTLEIEANAFAAELLMPRARIQECVSMNPIDIFDDTVLKRLAARFGVSTQAFVIRLARLGYQPT